MAQSLGRKLKRGNAIAYIDGQGKVAFYHKVGTYNILPSVEKRISTEKLAVCNLKPVKAKK